jgi:hypothetical protein
VGRPTRRSLLWLDDSSRDYVFVVKTSGLADAYFHHQPSTFQVPFSYASRTVRVSARADGPVSNPWASPELSFFVPSFG